ncbi:hypothetical protein ACOMHN_052656 [Nucella lapillus]
MTMKAFRLSYLFYVGIILPTVVTLALFVFFVICWRKQSARKMVLTKPYDPHGTMRKLGIPNTPPPPPLFLHHRGGLITPTSELEGEDNAAYDMSRSPSAEASQPGKSGGARPAPTTFQGSHLCVQLDNSVRQLQLLGSPSGELELTGRLAFHGHLDSGLSELACESPGGGSHEGGGGAGAGGGGAGLASRDRPQSQASHSSHSTDSEDSGFRSARSGQLSHQGHYEPPMFRRSRSAKRGKGRGCYHRAATSSPDSDTEPSLPLTPTALWSNHITNTAHHHPNTTTTTSYHPTNTSHHHNYPHQHQSSPDHLLQLGGGEEESGTKTIIDLDMVEADTHLGWKYLQELSSPGHKAKEKKVCGPASGDRQGKGWRTCQQSMTMAQVHTCQDLDNPDILGLSVV